MTHHAIYDAIWERFSDSIRVLLNNKFVFQPFWNHHAGLGYDNWEFTFEAGRRDVFDALGSRDTRVILNTLFDRLYVLRIQLMHGGVDVEELRQSRPGPRRRQDTRLPRASVRRPDDVPS